MVLDPHVLCLPLFVENFRQISLIREVKKMQKQKKNNCEINDNNIVIRMYQRPLVPPQKLSYPVALFKMKPLYRESYPARRPDISFHRELAS